MDVAFFLNSVVGPYAQDEHDGVLCEVLTWRSAPGFANYLQVVAGFDEQFVTRYWQQVEPC